MSASMRQSQALLDGVESHKTLEALMEQMRAKQEEDAKLKNQDIELDLPNHEARDKAKMIRAIMNGDAYDVSTEVRPTPQEIDISESLSDPLFQKYRDMLINKGE